MVELIFERVERDDEKLIGEFTFFCDTMTILKTEVLKTYKEYAGIATYVLEPDRYTPCMYAIRFPGATRGHIEVDENNIIKDIKFYGDSGIAKKEPHNVGIYKESIIEEVKKFIGRKIVI